jgi:hypothetical protein
VSKFGGLTPEPSTSKFASAKSAWPGSKKSQPLIAAREDLSANTTSHYLVTALIGIASCAMLLTKSFLSEHGYLSLDSATYLSVAENLLLGNGPFVTNEGRFTADLEYSAIHPIGYPFIIYAVANLLGVSTFIASKLLNASFFLGCMAVIATTFGRNGPALSVTMAFAGTLLMFSFTWSEAPFTFCLICFSALTANLLTNADRHNAKIILLFCLGVCLFLFRYIGAFAVGVIFFIAAYEFHKQRYLRAAKLSAVAATLIGVIAAYLTINHAHTGYFTGEPRLAAPETNLELAKQLGMAVAGELTLHLSPWSPANWRYYVVVAIQILAVAAVAAPLLWLPREKLGGQHLKTSLAFTIVGAAYLLSIIVLRWNLQLDAFGVRFLNPGAILLIVAAFNVVLGLSPEAGNRARLFLVLMAGLSLGVQSYAFITARSSLTYAEATAQRLERYRDVPPGSIVVFGDMHLAYLRPDLHLAQPRYRPYFADNEPWDAFIKTLDRSRRVFVDVPTRVPTQNRYHVTIRDFIAQYQDQGLIELDVH